MSKLYFETIADAIALEGQDLPMWDDKYGEAIDSIKSAQKAFKKEVGKIRATSDIEEKRALLSELLSEMEPLMRSDHHAHTETMSIRRAKRKARTEETKNDKGEVCIKASVAPAESLPRGILSPAHHQADEANVMNAVIYQLRNIGKDVSALLDGLGYDNIPDYEEDFDGFIAYALKTTKREFNREEGGQSEDKRREILTPFCRMPVKNLKPLMEKLDEIGSMHRIGSDGVMKCNGRDLTAIITILFFSREQLNFKKDIRTFEKFKRMLCDYYNVEVPKYKMNQVLDRALELQRAHYDLSEDTGLVSMKGVKI